MPQPANRARGVARTEVIIILVVLAVIAGIGCVVSALFLGLFLPALGKARSQAMTAKDSTQLRMIDQGVQIFSNELDGRLPTPGALMLELGDGTEAEDFTLNTSANFYSVLVAHEYLTPELLVGPTEVNEAITVKVDYDYTAYDPDNGSLWDPSFVMRIDDATIGANASFAHLAFVGDRRSTWVIENTTMPTLGTRGTRGGAMTGAEYDDSPTLRLHGPSSLWMGNVCFADGHVEMLQTFLPALTKFDNQPDNIFAAEFDHPDGSQAAGDAFLQVNKGATETTVDDIYDPLE